MQRVFRRAAVSLRSRCNDPLSGMVRSASKRAVWAWLLVGDQGEGPMVALQIGPASQSVLFPGESGHGQHAQREVVMEQPGLAAHPQGDEQGQ